MAETINKYQLRATLFFMSNNRAYSGIVKGIVEVATDRILYTMKITPTSEQKINEDALFTTKELLLSSL